MRFGCPTASGSDPSGRGGGSPTPPSPVSARWWPVPVPAGSTASEAAAPHRLIRTAQANGQWDDPVVRDRLVALYSEEAVRRWTNERVRATVKAGGTPGPAASIGKVHQGSLNQRIQLAAADLLGPGAQAWETVAPGRGPEAWAASLPYEVRGMLRSRANTIEGGTTEVNKNVLGEQVLGLAREPDPYHGLSWEETPRS